MFGNETGASGLFAKEETSGLRGVAFVSLPLQFPAPRQKGVPGPTAGRAEPKGFGKTIPATALAHGPPGGRPLARNDNTATLL